MDNNRSWMYQRTDNRGLLNDSFVVGLEEFMNHVISQPSSFNGMNINCPCTKCKFIRHWDAQTVKLHLLKKGFVKNYYVWNRHGEPYIARESAGQSSTDYSNISRERDEDNLMYNMVMDVAGPNFDPHSEEIPNAEAQKLYDMLHSSERELYDGCETSQLSAMARMLSLKSDHHLSETCYDETSQFIKSVLPEDNTFFDSFYNTKKHMAGLGLPSVKIDCCVNGCMIYWGEDIDMESCKFCEKSRYKTRVNTSTREKKKIKMRSPFFQAPQRSPEQASQCSPDQASQCSPDQALHQTQHRVRTPELTLQSTPELTLNNTPENTPYNIPESEPNMPDESSLIANNDVWEVGTMHTDGRLRIKVIKGL
ncbi:hypothetical protein POM88_033199 [Heracleum sosnowskyi]|uniref:Transposase-associated domain-containing protein n=1 Tax=Heracleum sosnowskyi TaxID=360622 RepID=A0AAD8I1W4_9APIA|nr:hypothetical protein POM88_033199 [Heracleum sosnowskyi]